jgi:FixJ family two-component response regulator
LVYIVDDDSYVRDGFEILLRSAGINSCSFESADAFIKQYTQGTDDLLLLDLHMPGMSGCELLSYIERTGIVLPVVIITAYDDPSSRACARKCGAIAFLRKPVDGDALIDIIKYNVSFAS